MENNQKESNIVIKLVSYILVAAIASGLTFFMCEKWGVGPADIELPKLPKQTKLEELAELIEDRFVGDWLIGA